MVGCKIPYEVALVPDDIGVVQFAGRIEVEIAELLAWSRQVVVGRHSM